MPIPRLLLAGAAVGALGVVTWGLRPRDLGAGEDSPPIETAAAPRIRPGFASSGAGSGTAFPDGLEGSRGGRPGDAGTGRAPANGGFEALPEASGANCPASAAAALQQRRQALRAGAGTGAGTGGANVAAGAEGQRQGRAADGSEPEAGFDGNVADGWQPLPGQKGEPAPDVVFDAGPGTRFVTETQAELPNTAPLDGRAGSISFWVKPDWQGDDQRDASFVQLGGSSLQMVKNVSFLRFEFFGQDGIEQGLGTRIDHWKPGEWHQVTGTWVDHRYQLFVDGEEVSRQFLPELPEFPDETRIYVGSNLTQGVPAPGEMAHLKILNRPMSPAEIAALLQSAERPR